MKVNIFTWALFMIANGLFVGLAWTICDAMAFRHPDWFMIYPTRIFATISGILTVIFVTSKLFVNEDWK